MQAHYQLMLVEVFLLPQLPSPGLPTVVVTVWLSAVAPYPSLEVKLSSPRPSAEVSDPQPSGGIIQTTVTVTVHETNCTNAGPCLVAQQDIKISNHIFKPLTKLSF
jgi:hypothetical protein